MHSQPVFGNVEVKLLVVPTEFGGERGYWNPVPRIHFPHCLMTFDPICFSETAYARYGIFLPASIQRSVPKRQAEYFFARLAVAHCLRALGRGSVHVGIGASREPLWPHGFVGSITHCDGVAAAVVAPVGEVRGIGLDIESADAVSPELAMAGSILDAHELAVLAQQVTRRSLTHAATAAFCAKECFFKATFGAVGHFFDFSAVRVIQAASDATTLVLRVNQTLASALPAASSHRVQICELAGGLLLADYAWEPAASSAVTPLCTSNSD